MNCRERGNLLCDFSGCRYNRRYHSLTGVHEMAAETGASGNAAVRTVVLSHWYTLVENLKASPAEFYQRVEKAIAERQVPLLERSRVEWHEGGVLSAKREYLRLARQRLVFDICAAPFGTGFFVSWRLGEIPLSISIIGVVLLLILLAVISSFLFATLGICWGLSVFVIALALGVSLMRQTVSHGLADLDDALLKIPVIGPLYDRFLRPITYYRIDLALMYQQAVHAAVTQIIDEYTKAQGLPLLSDFERKPILRELYRR